MLLPVVDMTAAATSRIVVVAPDNLATDADDSAAESEAQRSRWLRVGLLESGYNIIAVLPADVFLPERLAQIAPDMIIVDAESQARDTREHVVMASREARRPIVLFTDDNDMTHMPDTIAAGVTAYVVAGLAPERVKPVLDVALVRFRHEEAMRLELAAARSELSGRKTIARAMHPDAQPGHHRKRGLRAASQDRDGQRPEARRRGAAGRRRGRVAGLKHRPTPAHRRPRGRVGTHFAFCLHGRSKAIFQQCACAPKLVHTHRAMASPRWFGPAAGLVRTPFCFFTARIPIAYGVPTQCAPP